MSTNAAKRPEFLKSLMSNAPRHEPEVEVAEQTLKESRLAIPTPMLDIVFRSGKVRSFGYQYLSEIEFEPGDTLTLKFTSGVEITIEGRGLERHRRQVRLHRADEIRECPEIDLVSKVEDISQVENIYITKGQEE